MRSRPYSKWISRLFIALMAALAATGMMQMPLAKRYFITDIPGMAWTGDFYFVHKLHYVLAAMLLFLLGVVVVNWWLEWRDKLALTPMGRVRTAVVAGIVVSGGFRVYRNLPDITLDPILVLVIEWVHFGLVMLLGGLALAALLRGTSAYARVK